MRKALTALVIFLLVGLFAIGAQFYFYATEPYQSKKTDVHYFLVKKGENPTLLSRLLEKEGVISSETRFHWLGRITRKWSHVKAGEYALSASMSPLEILSVLTSGISVSHPITVREGENIYEIAKALEEKKLGTQSAFLELVKNQDFMKQLGLKEPLPPSLEGFLYPETYNFNRTQTLEDMTKIMFKKFQSVWGPKEEARAKELGLTQFEVLTLASMVEKETGAPQERPLIASVFHNRLKKKMRLQSDPTTIYGIWEHYKGNITKNDLLTPTPYNTYTVAALPAGPISNPGKEAIQAALYPQESQYLFFVSHNDGTHEFTETYGDHTKAVKNFQLNKKNKEGKSWRDLSKKLAEEKASSRKNKKPNEPKEKQN